MSSVVWILGAGFSKSLGAPLLGEMLRFEALGSVLKMFGDLQAQHQVKFTDVVETYLYGAAELPHNDKAQRRLWRHAEEFAEKLDAACESATAAGILRVMCGGAQKNDALEWAREMRDRTLQLMAAECCAFTTDADLDTERWVPYKRWAGKLTRADTVLTFNYDRVPELLAEHWDRERMPRLIVPSPTEARDVPDVARCLKLHGSVDWLRSKGERIAPVQQGDPLHAQHANAVAMYCSADEIGIATPGHSKYRLVKDDGELRVLWEQAAEALREARAVVIVGYSMPPSDAYSRSWLLEQVRENRKRQRERAQIARSLPVPPLSVHTVLGANTASPESTRLKGLFQSIKGVEVTQHPLWAEDFLDVFERDAFV